MKLNDKLFRSWYYLQLGWQVYFGIIFAFINFITLSYSFVIKNVTFLKNIFPDFVWFGIIVTIIVLNAATFMGYFHIKHGARKAENYIGYQVNPYFARKLVNTQMILNTYLIIGKLLTKINGSEKSTNDETNSLIQEIETMKGFVESRTISNKLDLKYIKAGNDES